ncbi:MAG: hypothetical protein E5X36_32310, partial [Mesorhizobium sp.]
MRLTRGSCLIPTDRSNPESRRRQYALKTRPRALGWENVVVIDDDLGRSGGGTARPGFEPSRSCACAPERPRSLSMTWT